MSATTVAVVIADTLAQAKDAAEAIAVDYEVLPGDRSTREGHSRHERRRSGACRGAGQPDLRLGHRRQAATSRRPSPRRHHVTKPSTSSTTA
jgi:CO/xanthine dehydrogenase Mo-binding subunit